MLRPKGLQRRDFSPDSSLILDGLDVDSEDIDKQLPDWLRSVFGIKREPSEFAKTTRGKAQKLLIPLQRGDEDKLKELELVEVYDTVKDTVELVLKYLQSNEFELNVETLILLIQEFGQIFPHAVLELILREAHELLNVDVPSFDLYTEVDRITTSIFAFCSVVAVDKTLSVLRKCPKELASLGRKEAREYLLLTDE